jgi:hypothetical protein
VKNGPSVLTINGPTAIDIPATALAKNKILITLTGDFVGISKITANGVTGSDSAGLTTATGAVQGEFLINTAKTAAYAVTTNTLAATPVAGATNGLLVAPEFTIDGIVE